MSTYLKMGSEDLYFEKNSLSFTEKSWVSLCVLVIKNYSVKLRVLVTLCPGY